MLELASVIGALQDRWVRRTLLLGTFSVSAIRNSSSLCPDRSAATSHRGCLPRPDHVSVGTNGLKYFGITFGYSRRGRSVLDSVRPASPICSFGFNRARRFSSSSFSAVIFS